MARAGAKVVVSSRKDELQALVDAALKRWRRVPKDIGAIAVFLASEAASFVTGQCIVADGGVTIL